MTHLSETGQTETGQTEASPLRDLLGRPWRGRLIALLVVAVLAGAVAWYVGMDLWHAAGVAAVVVAIGLAWMAVPDRPSTVWPVDGTAKDDGNRNDVSRLSWSLHTRRRRVRSDAVRRIRRLAIERLAARSADNPLDLDDPADRAAIERLIGSRAYRTLRSDPVRMPTFHDVESCLIALSGLLGENATPADPPARRHHSPIRKSTS